MAIKAGRVGVRNDQVDVYGKIKDNSTPYVLPTASADTLGGVKVGNGLSIADGVLAANGYTLPVATSSSLGGVKPVTKTEAMTKEVGIDAEGKLYVEPSTGGGEVSSAEFDTGYVGNLTYATVDELCYISGIFTGKAISQYTAALLSSDLPNESELTSRYLCPFIITKNMVGSSERNQANIEVGSDGIYIGNRYTQISSSSGYTFMGVYLFKDIMSIEDVTLSNCSVGDTLKLIKGKKYAVLYGNFTPTNYDADGYVTIGNVGDICDFEVMKSFPGDGGYGNNARNVSIDSSGNIVVYE